MRGGVLRRLLVALVMGLAGCVSSKTTHLVYGPTFHRSTPAASPIQQPPVARSVPSPQPAVPPTGVDTDPGAGGDVRRPNLPARAPRAEGAAVPLEPYPYCVVGLQVLQRVDQMEHEGQAISLSFQGAPETVEAMAHRFIGGCVKQLGQITVAADSAEGDLLSATAAAWRANLARMQAWLVQRMKTVPAGR
jgi:hypothetical protein